VWTKRVQPEVAADAEMIFAGYGVQAPEFQWDDLKGEDVRGKFIVVLVNDPPLADEKLFGGKAMTYYGRWTYKFEKAAELGAAGCLIIHETGPAGYPWAVVQGNTAEKFDLLTPDRNAGRAAVEGWITNDSARALFRAAGLDLDAQMKYAASRDFRPVPLGFRAATTIRNTLRTVDSRNVIARLPGSDPRLRNQYVIFTAHWDHFGIGREINGDKIYNGAKDNASGTGALLEIARALSASRPRPRRSILFLAVTAEEQGLLGARYYAEHPLYPLARTAAVVNMDALNTVAPTLDLVSIGKGSSTIDAVVEGIARQQGRRVTPDAEPEKGYFYRSDHFEFAKQGVPAFYGHGGVVFAGLTPEEGRKLRERYTVEDYHKPSDEVKPGWDWNGLMLDVETHLQVGLRIANAERMPEWMPGNEFRARREASLRDARQKP